MFDQSFDRRHGKRLQQVVGDTKWIGTPQELYSLLARAGGLELPSPAHLGRWLRRCEPILWWDYRLRVEFSRTGVKRKVRLSRRDANLIEQVRGW